MWNDDDLAQRLERDAASLKRRFNEDSWLDREGYFALALDGGNELVPTIASNAGQLLWSGIVDQEKVHPLVTRLLSPAMFSGWGVRTLASGQGAYNPIEYHNGTVWPHDNALIAAGLARYGQHEAAGRIVTGILTAAASFGHRLPEVVAGYPRGATPAALPASRWSTRRHVPRKHGLPGRRCCCSASHSDSDRPTTGYLPTHICPTGSARCGSAVFVPAAVRSRPRGIQQRRVPGLGSAAEADGRHRSRW